MDKTLCGSQFPYACKFTDDTQFTCPKEGEKPTPCKSCLPQKCEVKNDMGSRAPNPCACADVQVGKNYCGSQFPGHCLLASNTLYTSSKAGDKPWEAKDCLPQDCNVDPAMSTDACAPDPCRCTAAQVGQMLCDSQFPGHCSLVSNTLYACNKPGDKPTMSKDCSPQECAVMNGLGARTKDSCACTDTFATKCGSSFPDGCYAKESVFTCTNL